MDFIEAVITTNTPGIELLSARLIMDGVTGFAIEDAEDFKEFLEDTTPRWDYVDEDLMKKMDTDESRITVYLTNDVQGKELLLKITKTVTAMKAEAQAGTYGALTIDLKNVRQEDWDGNWKQFFKPLNVGKRFIIKPSWEECEPEDGRLILEIDPASSFGTGGHHTTQLCLCALEDVIKAGDKVLDMGCGSGILGIGAALLGAGKIKAIDIDEHCIKTALENFEKNHISGEKYSADYGNIVEDEELCCKIGTGYDVIAANIVADVIIAMRERFMEFLRDDGTLIVSGLISERADEVESKLVETGFKTVSRSSSSDWCAIVMKK